MKKHRLTLIMFCVFAGTLILIWRTSGPNTDNLLNDLGDRLQTAARHVGEMSPEKLKAFNAELKKDLDTLQKKAPRDPRTWSMVARFHLYENQEPVADAKGVPISPSDREGLLAAAKALDLIEMAPEAEKALLENELHKLKARFQLRLSQAPEAEKTLIAAWKKNDQDPQTAKMLSEAYQMMASGNDENRLLEEALGFATLALELSKQTINTETKEALYTYPDAFNQRARVHMRQLNYFKARLDLLEAIRLRPTYTDAYYNLALSCLMLSIKYEKAPKNKETYRLEAIRYFEELRNLDHDLASKLYYEHDFKVIHEGF